MAKNGNFILPDSAEELVHEISDTFNQILRENIYETNLNKAEFANLEENKRKLRSALKVCSTGNPEAREFVKDAIRDILIEKYRINEETINRIISFGDIRGLSVWDKFQISLYSYEKTYGSGALKAIITEYGLDMPFRTSEASIPYEITEEDVDIIFLNCAYRLSFLDKVNIVTQRIYCLYKGLGIADDIREMDIDGVSGGVSGRTADEKTLWIFFEGKSFSLSFLRFGSERELERICHNIYRYNQPGHLSRNRGYIVNDMNDHSRVVVARPPFSESWVFFVRKFNKNAYRSIYDLFRQENSELITALIGALIKGCRTCAVTGTQGSGKTTLLMSLIEFINPGYNIRVQELSFELHLRDIYPKRNIVTFRETDFISGQEGLDLQKKTDGAVNILGEVASAPVAGWMIQMGLTASVFTLFTHHAKTTDTLVSALANALLSENIYQDETAARKQVSEVVEFDIHMGMDFMGERFVERITEIVRDDSLKGYHTTIIAEFDGNGYVLRNRISRLASEGIISHLKSEERQVFLDRFGL